MLLDDCMLLTSTKPCSILRTMKMPEPAIAAEGRKKLSSPDIAMAVPNTLQRRSICMLGTLNAKMKGTINKVSINFYSGMKNKLFVRCQRKNKFVIK